MLLFNEIECSKDIGSVDSDSHCVFEMSSGLTIFGSTGPPVFAREDDILGTHAYHRFNSYDHTLFEQRACTRHSIIGDVGAFVHFEADTVAT